MGTLVLAGRPGVSQLAWVSEGVEASILSLGHSVVLCISHFWPSGTLRMLLLCVGETGVAGPVHPWVGALVGASSNFVPFPPEADSVSSKVWAML